VFEERYKDIGCQVCKVLSRTISGRGQLRKSPRKSSWWDLFPEPDSVTSIRVTQLWITFPCEKNRQIKPEMFYIAFDCYHFNQARTCPDLNIISATRPRPGPRAGSGQTRVHADLYPVSSSTATVATIYGSSSPFFCIFEMKSALKQSEGFVSLTCQITVYKHHTIISHSAIRNSHTCLSIVK
jgi:hypothetical protein